MVVSSLMQFLRFRLSPIDHNPSLLPPIEVKIVFSSPATVQTLIPVKDCWLGKLLSYQLSNLVMSHHKAIQSFKIIQYFLWIVYHSILNFMIIYIILFARSLLIFRIFNSSYSLNSAWLRKIANVLAGPWSSP